MVQTQVGEILRPFLLETTASQSLVDQAKSKSRYRPEIDGIRALAVIAVIINHFNKEIYPGGYLGVDIFFVISGFVITSSLAGRSSKDFGDFLLEFYSRRVKRIIPALLVFVLPTGLLISIFNPDPKISLYTGIASLFGVSNIFLQGQATDYFADSTELNVFTHTWSLGVEEQFYFLFPFLLWFSGFTRNAESSARRLFGATAILSLVSFVAFLIFQRLDEPMAYFSMPSRFWEIGAGSLLFLSLRRQDETRSGFFATLWHVPPVLPLAVILGAMATSSRVGGTIAVVASTVVLIATLRPGTAVFSLLTHRSVVFLGLISYSLYLWHWGVISLSRWTIGIHWWSAPFQLVFIFLLAIVSYRYIETPFRRTSTSAFRLLSIGFAMACSLLVAGLLSVIGSKTISLYAGRAPALIEVGPNSLKNPYRLRDHNKGLLEPSYAWAGKPCYLEEDWDAGKKFPLTKCTIGDFSTANQRVLVLGNSFSVAFTQAFDDMVLEDNFAVTITSSPGAWPVPNLTSLKRYEKANNWYWSHVVPELTGRLLPGDWVFLINDLAPFFQPSNSTSLSMARLQMLKIGLEMLSSRLSSSKVRLAVLHGLPLAREANCQPAIAVRQWFHPFGPPCQIPDRAKTLRMRQDLDDVLMTLQDQGKIKVIDVFDVFCPDDKCTYTTPSGVVLYRDEYSHPSVEAARLVAPIFRKYLTAVSALEGQVSVSGMIIEPSKGRIPKDQ
jgi:peptidoglycan/LPS O-acetylase OafA/YrhL